MKHLLFLMLFCCAVCVSAQDVIVKKDGSTVVCRVLEVKSSEVVYKLWTERNGSSYIMDLSLVSSINYESGKKESFSDITENKFLPYNQSNGERQINDKALLIMDDLNKVKRLKIVGYTVGGTIVAGGIVIMSIGLSSFSDDCLDYGGYGWKGYEQPGSLWTGVALIPVGAAITTACLIKSNKIKKEYNKVQNYALYQQDFKLKNGNSITPSVDMLKYTDKGFKTQTIGMGLSYNF